MHASSFVSSNFSNSQHSHPFCLIFEEIRSYFLVKMGCQNECFCIYIEPCIWSYPVDRNSSCLVNLLYIWPLLAAEVLFSSWLLGSNAYSLLSLFIKTPQRCFITNCLMVSVKVDIFGFFHLKLNVFCHIVWIKRQSCLKRFISVLLVANYFWSYFKNIKNVLTQLVDLYCIFHGWEEVSYHRLTEGGANGINYVETTEEEEEARATNLETVARLPASSADPTSRDPTEQNLRKMAFTFAAFCYMLALLLTAALIFFAIWHVSTRRGDISDDGCPVAGRWLIRVS